MSDQFGTIFISTEFDEAVKVFLKKWVDTYLSRIELQLGIDARSYDRPKSWNFLFDNDVEKWPEDKLPSIMIVSAEFEGSPERVGEGHYAGWWNWAVVAIVSQRDFDSTRKATQAFAAALRTAVVQHPSLEGAVGDTEFVGESLDYLAGGRSRTLGLAALEFRSFIETVVEESEGPLAPDEPGEAPPEEYTDWPLVETVDVDLQPESVND